LPLLGNRKSFFQVVEVEMIVGVCAQAGSGKDTTADFFVEDYGYFKVALADPIKRFCAQMYGFSYDQLWGPSELRNKVDERYGFTPREILQQLGTEFGRHYWEDVWISYALRVAQALLNPPPVPSGAFFYTPDHGLIWEEGNTLRAEGVVIPDVRFRNEAERINAAGGVVLKVIRPGSGLKGEAGQHASETSLQTIPYSLIAREIINDSSVSDLRFAVADFYSEVIAKNIQ